MQLKHAIRKALDGYVDNLTPSEGKKKNSARGAGDSSRPTAAIPACPHSV